MVIIRGNTDDIKPDGFDIPPGRYLARLTKVEKDDSKTSGKPMLVWWWQIVDGGQEGAEILSFTTLPPSRAYALVNHLAAFGLRGKVDVDLSTLQNRKAVIIVATRKVVRGEYVDYLPTVVAVLPEDTWYAKQK